MLLDALAVLSSIIAILSFIISEKRHRQEKRRKRKETYQRQLDDAQEKDAQLPARSERPKGR